MFKVATALLITAIATLNAQTITPTGYEFGVFREDNSITASIDIPQDTITCRLTDNPLIAPPPPLALVANNKLVWGGETNQTPECSAVVDLRNIPGAYYAKMLAKGLDANGTLVKGNWSNVTNYFYVAGGAPQPPGPFTSTCPTLPPLTVMWPETSAQLYFASPTTSGGVSPVNSVCTPASGAVFNLGNTNVSCVSTDGINRTSSCSLTVNIVQMPKPPQSDTTAPSVSESSKRSGNSSNYVVTGKTSDNVGVVLIKFMLDGLTKYTLANPPGTVQYTMKIDARGSHVIRVEASDAVNNIGAAGETIVR